MIYCSNPCHLRYNANLSVKDDPMSGILIPFSLKGENDVAILNFKSIHALAKFMVSCMDYKDFEIRFCLM